MEVKSLSEIAYYRTGGSCERLYLPEKIEEIISAVQEIHRLSMPLFVLGGGTNSLVCDETWPGAVIAMVKMQGLRKLDGSGRVFCESGVENTRFAHFAAAEGLNGAGWMNRLPGQMGGTVRMNARCYGGEISQIVQRVTSVDLNGNVVVHSDPKKIFRGYKDTSLMETGEIVVSVELKLEPGNTMETLKQMRFCEDDRIMKGQFTHPSCGCVFKNDYKVGVPSGMLLEAAGAKLLTKGGACVSQQHANFVFNTGASSREILELTLMMREAVYSKFGVWLDYEMEILGRIPGDLAAKIKESRPRGAETPELVSLRQQFKSR
jgi:UDP-N-acetylmuramate dehydrogenase